jgi:hypothetical protein
VAALNEASPGQDVSLQVSRDIRYAVDDWAGSNADAIREALNGSPSFGAAQDDAKVFASALAVSGPDAPELFRGMLVESSSPFARNLSVGKTISVGLSSFSASQEVAETFTADPAPLEIPIHMVVDAGAHGLNIAPLSRLHDEEEWISGGKFKVTDVARGSWEEGITIHLTQVSGIKAKRDDAPVSELIPWLDSPWMPDISLEL